MNRLVAPITVIALAAGLLGACGSMPPSGTNGLPAMPPYAEPAPNQPLQGEQRWLEDWFRGTPVVIQAEPQGAVRIEVPLRHSFDPGRVEIKQPLDAVLVRVAASMRRQPAALMHLVVPRDPKSDGSLSLDRGDKVGERLATLGIAPARIASVLVGAPTVMRMRLIVPPTP